MSGNVLVVADESDSTADDVCAALDRRGQRWWRFDTAEFPGHVRIAAERADDRWNGCLWRGGDRLYLDDVQAVYLRRGRPFEVPAHLSTAERWHAAMECRYGLGGVLTSLPVRYMNHPSRSADASYKPRQLERRRRGSSLRGTAR